ncbi:MAG: energy-coupling factor transporter transmembrane component T family protein [Promethearchaeota archaeon]
MTGYQIQQVRQRNHSVYRHAIDVRSKIITTFLVVLACSFLVELNQLFWFYIIFGLFILILRPHRDFLKSSLVTLPIIVSLSIVSFFSFSSSPVIYKSVLYTTIHNNLSLALFLGLRSYLIAIFVLILIYSEADFFEIIYGLDELGMPELLTSLTFFTYRFFFLMQEELTRILEARSNRLYGEKLRINLESLKVIGNILGGLLARSFRRAEHVSASLSARGFSGKLRHPHHPWTIQGIVFFVTMTFITIITMIMGQLSPIMILKDLL